MDQAAEAEFRAFVHSRGRSLYRSAYLLTGDHQLAEDLVQSALARVARRWTRLTDRCDLEAYVRRVMYHHQVSRWRLRSWNRETSTDTLPERSDGADPFADAELRLQMVDALAKLPLRQRAVVVLRYYEDLPEREVATILDISVGTVRSQTHRALTRLRALFPDLVGTTTEAEEARQ